MDFLDLSQRHASLAAPLDWAFAEVLPLLSSEPSLGLQLLTAERPRLHFLAFVLAMMPGPATPEVIRQAFTKPMRDVLAKMHLSHVRGLRRLLGRIPDKVMARGHYKLLASLLTDASAAAVLHHATEVSPELLDNIRVLPAEMRSPVIVDAIAHIAGAAQDVLLWIDIAGMRSGLQPADMRLTLGHCRSLAELRTELDRILDALPALEAAPPQLVHGALRIDTPSAIRQLGKRFKNCLAGFVDAEVDGTAHIYHWQADTWEAVCEVARVSNLGWFLGSHLGPENDPLSEAATEEIRAAFAKVGIHPLKIVETYDDLYFGTGGRDSAFANGNRRSRHVRRGR